MNARQRQQTQEPEQHDAVQQFEDLLIELQETFKRLEGDELTLDEAIAAYERSVTIATQCATILDNAELRISQIDAESRQIREQASIYQVEEYRAASLLLGDDDDDLTDLLGLDDDEDE